MEYRKTEKGDGHCLTSRTPWLWRRGSLGITHPPGKCADTSGEDRGLRGQLRDAGRTFRHELSHCKAGHLRGGPALREDARCQGRSFLKTRPVFASKSQGPGLGFTDRDLPEPPNGVSVPHGHLEHPWVTWTRAALSGQAWSSACTCSGCKPGKLLGANRASFWVPRARREQHTPPGGLLGEAGGDTLSLTKDDPFPSVPHLGTLRHATAVEGPGIVLGFGLQPLTCLLPRGREETCQHVITIMDQCDVTRKEKATPPPCTQ